MKQEDRYSFKITVHQPIYIPCLIFFVWGPPEPFHTTYLTPCLNFMCISSSSRKNPGLILQCDINVKWRPHPSWNAVHARRVHKKVKFQSKPVGWLGNITMIKIWLFLEMVFRPANQAWWIIIALWRLWRLLGGRSGTNLYYFLLCSKLICDSSRLPFVMLPSQKWHKKHPSFTFEA